MTTRTDPVYPIIRGKFTCKCGAELQIDFEDGRMESQCYYHRCGQTIHVDGKIREVRELRKGKWLLVGP